MPVQNSLGAAGAWNGVVVEMLVLVLTPVIFNIEHHQFHSSSCLRLRYGHWCQNKVGSPPHSCYARNSAISKCFYLFIYLFEKRILITIRFWYSIKSSATFLLIISSRLFVVCQVGNFQMCTHTSLLTELLGSRPFLAASYCNELSSRF